MKFLNFKSIVLTVFLTLFITGCGNSGDYSKANSTQQLIVGEEVEVFSSDTVQPADDSTVLELRHVVESDKKYVTLISGNAELIKGDYSSAE